MRQNKLELACVVGAGVFTTAVIQRIVKTDAKLLGLGPVELAVLGGLVTWLVKSA